jgi:hypothetical protein
MQALKNHFQNITTTSTNESELDDDEYELLIIKYDAN